MTRARLTLGVLASAGIFLAACERPAEQPPSRGAAEPPSRAAEPPSSPALLLPVDSLASTLDDPGTVVLHVARTPESFESARIPGARFLPLSAIVTERDGLPNELPDVAVLDSVFESVGVADDARVVLYGDPLATARAFFTLDVLGHRRVAMLDGGVEAWRAAGGPVASGADSAGAFASRSFTPRLAGERIVDADWVAARLDDPSIAVIDARPPEEYSGATPGDGVTRPGHIPGSANVFWKQALVADSMPRLRDTTALRRLYAAAGAAPGDTVVTLCRTGVQASHAYFVARLLGYTVRMYDGSFIDWSRQTAREVGVGAARPAP